MKTAISLPDPLFEEAEAMAKEMGVSRSELYASALEAFLRDRRRAEITERLNEVYKDEPSGLDPVVAAMQAASIQRDDW
jgi:antitoxin MazE6